MAITLEAAARHFTHEAIALLGLLPTSFVAHSHLSLFQIIGSYLFVKLFNAEGYS